MRRSQENLRSSVPEGDNLVCVALEGNSKSPAEAEIGDLKDSFILVDEEVLGLEIPVEDAMAVTMSNALAELKEETLDLGSREGPGIGTLAVGVDELLEISVQILEDKVKEGLAILLLVVNDVLDAEETYDVEGVRKHLEEGNLTEGGGGNTFLVHLETSLLQGDELAGGLVFGLVNLTVSSFADLLQFLVLFHF